jgi:hypothetical protein
VLDDEALSERLALLNHLNQQHLHDYPLLDPTQKVLDSAALDQILIFNHKGERLLKEAAGAGCAVAGSGDEERSLCVTRIMM